MLTTTSTLRAALDARARRLRGRLLVDWDVNGYGSTIDDLSNAFSSIEVERELAIDVPQEVKLVAGHVAGKLTAKLATPGRTSTGGRVDPRVSARAYFSTYRADQPLYLKERRLRPTLAQIQAITSAGIETLPWFTGKTEELLAEAQPDLLALDGWGDAAKQIMLPLVLGDDRGAGTTARKPNLYADWIVDYIFRRLGYYASPPRRSNCVWMATLHGSTYPEVGNITATYGQNSTMLAFPPDADPASGFNYPARFHRGVHTNGTSDVGGQMITGSLLAGAGTNNGQFVAYEGWHRFMVTTRDQPLFKLYQGTQTALSCFWRTSTGQMVVTVNRGGADTNHSSGDVFALTPGTSWHYFYVHFAFTSTGVNVTLRVDGTTTTFTIATGSITGVANLDRIGVARGVIGAFAETGLHGISESVQVTTEATPGSYNNGFSPTAVLDPSYNQLDATPGANRIEAASLLTLIAAAEMAQIGFTETGLAYFYNRNRWLRAPATVSQKTLSTVRNIEELPIREARTQVRNKITAQVTPPDPSTGDIWKAPKVFGIGGGGTKTILASLKNPATNIDTTLVATTTGGQSRYQANANQDGSGTVLTNLTFVVTQIDVNTLKMVITNPNGGPAWLVNTSGKPYVYLNGDAVKFGEDNSTESKNLKVESADTVATIKSAGTYGEQLLELNPEQDNPFFQNEDVAQQLVDDLAVWLTAPKPVIEEFVLAQGDPSLRLGDRVTIQDAQAGVAADFFLTKIRGSLDAAGGFKQTIDGRGA